MSAAGWVVVVDDGDDPLANAVHAALDLRGASVLRLRADALAATRLELRGDEAQVRGQRVRAVLFRAMPGGALAAGFHDDDESFSSSEARAAWLALLQLPSVIAINRADPETWFALSDWPIWRRRLAGARIPLAPLAVGDVDVGPDATWLPWGGGIARVKTQAVRRVFGAAVVPSRELTHVVVADGESVEAGDGEGVRGAVEVLRRWGVLLAGIVVDDKGRVVSATAAPFIPTSVASAAARRLTEVLTADLPRR